jgi:hypothetical protein
MKGKHRLPLAGCIGPPALTIAPARPSAAPPPNDGRDLSPALPKTESRGGSSTVGFTPPRSGASVVPTARPSTIAHDDILIGRIRQTRWSAPDGELALLVGDVAPLSSRGVEEYSDQPAAFGIDKALLRGVPVSPRPVGR